jgi:hypothetical protein
MKSCLEYKCECFHRKYEGIHLEALITLRISQGRPNILTQPKFIHQCFATSHYTRSVPSYTCRGISVLTTTYKILSNILVWRSTPLGIISMDFDVTNQLLITFCIRHMRRPVTQERSTVQYSHWIWCTNETKSRDSSVSIATGLRPGRSGF